MKMRCSISNKRRIYMHICAYIFIYNAHIYAYICINAYMKCIHL
jgi:hypothetical protein